MAGPRASARGHDWTPPGERIRQAPAEIEQDEQIRKIADMMPTVAEYGERYCSRHDLSPVTADKYRGLLRLYINAEPTSVSGRGGSRGRPWSSSVSVTSG
jgi:hypothetical protein